MDYGFQTENAFLWNCFQQKGVSQMSVLPTTMLEPSATFRDLMVLIYGPIKIGKSSFAAQWWRGEKGKVLFLATEKGLKSLKRYEVQIDSWEKFIETCKEIRDKKPGYSTIVIDTVDNLWKFCMDYVCRKFDMSHPSDEEWGKGWDLVKDEFRRKIVKLSMLGYGIVFISHQQEKNAKSRHRSLDKTMPTMPNSCRSIVMPMVDIIAHLGVREVEKDGEVEERRVASFKPSETLEAGDRTGKLPARMDMGKSAQEFYQEFRACFDGAQKKKGTKHE